MYMDCTCCVHHIAPLLLKGLLAIASVILKYIKYQLFATGIETNAWNCLVCSNEAIFWPRCKNPMWSWMTIHLAQTHYTTCFGGAKCITRVDVNVQSTLHKHIALVDVHLAALNTTQTFLDLADSGPDPEMHIQKGGVRSVKGNCTFWCVECTAGAALQVH